MNNEWKLIPVELTEEMNKSGMRWLSGIQHMRAADKRNALHEAFKAMLAASPVPPTGADVEVWSVDCPDDPSTGIDVVIYSDYLVHVTRLQAEVERLNVVNKKLGEDMNEQTAPTAFGEPVFPKITYFDDVRKFLESETAKDNNRLGAERDALQQRLTIADQRVDYLESELAKARELLKRLTAYGRVNFDLNDADAARVEAYEFLAHQSVPAAKGGE